MLQLNAAIVRSRAFQSLIFQKATTEPAFSGKKGTTVLVFDIKVVVELVLVSTQSVLESTRVSDFGWDT